MEWKVSWDDETPNIWESINIHVPNHQSDKKNIENIENINYEPYMKWSIFFPYMKWKVVKFHGSKPPTTIYWLGAPPLRHDPPTWTTPIPARCHGPGHGPVSPSPKTVDAVTGETD